MDATHLYRMLVFAHVVEQGSLTAAAQQLGLSRSMVSQHLKNLEARLSQQLLQRTTRRIALTDVGRDFYHQCAELSQLAKQAEVSQQLTTTQVYGHIRLVAPEAWANQGLLPQLGLFHQTYPDIRLNLILAQYAASYEMELSPDVAIKVSQTDRDVTENSLCQLPQQLVASPSYLAQHGKPLHPDSLHQFHWLAASNSQLPQSVCLFDSSGQQYQQRLTPFCGTNSLLGLLHLAEQGFGIASLPHYLCEQAISEQRLIRVLPSYQLPSNQLVVTHRFGENPPRRVSVLLAFLQQTFAKTA